MAILIMGIIDALDFVPTSPTYALRIRSSHIDDLHFPPLMKNDLYVAIKEYVFDDLDHWRKERKGIFFNKTIAANILRDYSDNRGNSRDLLVHCSGGNNRAPALALGMNRVFNLGANEEEIVRKHKYGTWWMADRLIDTARELGLVSSNTEGFGLPSLREEEED